MTKKSTLRVSELYLRSIAEEHAVLINKAAALIGNFERRKIPLTAAQSRQLNHALDCIAEGLFSLAACELDDFAPRRQHIDLASADGRQPATIDTGDGETKSDNPQELPISLVALRQKLTQVNDARRSTLKRNAPEETTPATGRLPSDRLTTN